MTTIADRAQLLAGTQINAEDLIYKKVMFRLIPFLFLCYVCSYLNLWPRRRDVFHWLLRL
jgi:hypothetical protein